MTVDERGRATLGTDDAEQPPLRQNRDYTYLIAGGAISSLGSRMSSLAFPLITLAATGSPFAVGLVAGATTMALVLVGLPAGALVDRWDRRRTMIFAAALGGTAYLSVAIAAFADHITVPHLMLAAACGGVANGFYAPAEQVAVRHVVRKSDIPRAAVNNQVRSATAGLAGPPIGGLLFGITRGLPMVADALTYLVAIVCASRVRTPLPGTAIEDREALLPSIRTGLRFLFGHQLLRTITLLSTVLNFAGTGLVVSVTITMQQRGTAPGWIGAVSSAMAVSMLVASLLAGRILQHLSVGLLMFLTPVVGAVAFAGMAFVHAPVALMVLMACATFLLAPCNAAVVAVLTARTPADRLGRVMSADNVLSLVLTALAPATMGFLIGAAGGEEAMMTFAVLLLLSGVLVLAFPRLMSMPAVVDSAGQTA
ncbi:MAG TPA: MFS transporter [Flexivirga sp.]|uniref:MFS transporter n=1 Tax=Flexivirga sp. TaxID=1962927 RepID=UPI002D025525|nr:MFS transporter [Flexivirga sp.]HWC23368.1 MFS transporter [Flexivirga sp.]